MPVKIKDNFLKAKNVDVQLALGDKYRIMIGKCKNYRNQKFCEGISAYRSIKNNTNLNYLNTQHSYLKILFSYNY